MTLRLPGTGVTRNTDYLVGIDAGGTKTHILAESPDGDILLDHVAFSGDWSKLDFPGKASALTGLLRAVGLDRPAVVAVGAHGCDSDLECQALQGELEKMIASPVIVVNDAFLLLPPDRTAPVAGLVVGTGSIAVARDSTGRSLYAGGWGWLVGDAGSAWGIVREAVRSLTRRTDRSDDQFTDPLLPKLLNASGTADLRHLVDVLQNHPASTWAGWAPIVFAGLDAGSPAAEQAIDTGVASLVTHVEDLAIRGALVERVVCGGAVILGQPELQHRLGSRLAELGLELAIHREPPVRGAIRLARMIAAV